MQRVNVRSPFFGLPLLASLLLGACTTARTEIVLVVGSDLSVPAEIDRLRVEITSPSGSMQESIADLDSVAGGLPRTLGLVHRDGPLGPFRARVVGLLGSATVVERVAVISFVEDQTMMLRIDLVRACSTVTCMEAQTCALGSCRSEVIDPGELVPWRGQVQPSGDGGGTDDAGAPPDAPPVDAPPRDAPCTGGAETCNGVDDDCDTRIDEDFDLMTDPANCGRCASTCSFTGANRYCCMGSCVRDPCP